MSAGSPMAPIGERFLMALTMASISVGSARVVIGVTTKPGATAFTRTPRGPASWAATRVSMATPAFEIE